MKKTVLTLTIGILVGLLAGSISGAFAAVSETVEAQFAKFTLIINKGDPVEIEPLTYKGTTYLPIREAANLTGYDLTYKADSRTIELNKTIDSLLTEVEQIGIGGGDMTQITPVVEDIEKDIENLKMKKQVYEISRNNAIELGYGEDVVAEINARISETEQKIAELESQLQSQTP